MKKIFFTVNHTKALLRKAGWIAAHLFAMLCMSSWALGAVALNHLSPNLCEQGIFKGNAPLIVLAYRDDKPPYSNYGNLSNEEKRKLQDKYKKWNALPPGEKKKLRNRMNQLRNMSPQDQKNTETDFNNGKGSPPRSAKNIKRT